MAQNGFPDIQGANHGYCMDLYIVNTNLHPILLLDLSLSLIGSIRIAAGIRIIELKRTVDGIAILEITYIRFHICLMPFMNHVAKVNGPVVRNAVNFEVVDVVHVRHHTNLPLWRYDFILWLMGGIGAKRIQPTVAREVAISVASSLSFEY
jgi:hypothetical protein